MVTMISRLCGLCAMSAMLEMLLFREERGSMVRMVCGLLMLHMTLSDGREMVMQMIRAEGLDEIFRILIG
ncbi:MAG: hypothetical protein J6M47_03610 [Clostridia bacterium]|nr:hypothetical protein [Clostridia bacterium]